MNRRSSPPWKPTKAQLLAARNKLVPDLAAKDLIVLFAGINPGLYTAAIGRHFGRPGNPFEGSPLLHLKFGTPTMVERAPAGAADLTADELRAGGQRLQAKVK